MVEREQIVYHETQPMKRWILYLVGVVITLIVTSLLLIGQFLPSFLPWLAPPLIIGAILLLLGAITFRRLFIEVTDTHLSFGFGWLRKRLPLPAIKSVEARPYLFCRFVGWGFRYDLRDTFGYVAQSGMGIEVQTKNRWRYFVTTGRADHLVKIIKGMTKRTSSCNKQAAKQ